MSLKSSNTYFARGAGCASRYAGSDTILFTWHGRADGSARYVEHVRRYARNRVEHKSFAALLRAVEAEHREAETGEMSQ